LEKKNSQKKGDFMLPPYVKRKASYSFRFTVGHKGGKKKREKTGGSGIGKARDWIPAMEKTSKTYASVEGSTWTNWPWRTRPSSSLETKKKKGGKEREAGANYNEKKGVIQKKAASDPVGEKKNRGSLRYRKREKKGEKSPLHQEKKKANGFSLGQVFHLLVLI